MKAHFAALAAALLVPSVAMADTYVVPSAPPASETIVEDPINAPVFGTGLFVFAASYGTSLAFAASADSNEPNHHLYVPLVGPWLALADRPDCNVSSTRCDNETTAKVFLVLDGIFQAGGVLTMIDGLLSPSYHHEVVVADNSKKVRVHPTVVVGQAAAAPGLGFSGRF